MTTLALRDIQGFVLFGYRRYPHARYLHVELGTTAAAKAWLAGLLPDITNANDEALASDRAVHVAFTAAGLAQLGLATTDLATFPRELQEGMAGPTRAHVLGDDPATWEFGGTKPGSRPVHALVLVYTETVERLDQEGARLAGDLARHGGSVVHTDQVCLREREHEAFGFRDGLAQPHIDGSPRPPREIDDCIPTGEFLLGYENAYEDFPALPTMGSGRSQVDLGNNGTYLVYRKLRQDTVGFWRAMLEHAETPGDPDAAVKLASQIVGRWPSGAPLVRYPDRDPGTDFATNDFGFAHEDAGGRRCPFGAHIRRANPRDMLKPGAEESQLAVRRHRLLRRGRSYGEPSLPIPLEAANEANPPERGLVFMGLNASFRRQFEFIQQTWIENTKFAGLTDERDPLVGTCPMGQHFSIQADPARRRVSGLRTFVSMVGGAYFFVPGLTALSRLAR